jgi:predicted naringenin-chalcone synthase
MSALISLGTSVPPNSYSQQDVIDEFGIDDEKIISIFANSAIDRRHLVLPPRDENGVRVPETTGQLLSKHRAWGINMGAEALTRCLAGIDREVTDVDYLCCVTTTGFLTPGLSARLMRELGMRPDCSRLDVVGMGCNAGLNALAPVAAWAEAHPGKLAVMICIEACSAAYVFDGTMRTSVVNSLFGDGAAAVAVYAGDDAELLGRGPKVVKISSHIILDAIDAMRYDWDDERSLFSFFLDPQIPYVIGANAEEAVARLLTGTGVGLGDVSHWLVHSGGKKVIDALRINVGLSRHDVRHTLSVLRDYGNLSSGSFLFSFERLNHEGVTRPGDYGVAATMGPGSTIELALLQW